MEPETDQGQQGQQQQEQGNQGKPGTPPPSPPPKGSDEDYWRKQAEAANAKLKQLERAKMTDDQRRQAEHEESMAANRAATERANQALIKAEFSAAARQMNVVDVETALAVAKGLSVDGDGNVRGVEKALQELKRGKPFLFAGGGKLGSGGGNAPTGGGGSESPNKAVNDWIRRKAGK